MSIRCILYIFFILFVLPVVTKLIDFLHNSVTVAWFIWNKLFSWNKLGINYPFDFITNWK